MNPFEVWAPIFRAPFSGDVTQEIAPRVLSPDIKGNPHIESKIQTEVASYGKQLGKILEALQTLSQATETPIPEIEQLIIDVEAVKASSKDAVFAEAQAALEKLQKVDEKAWRELTNAK